jgi:Tfp pilus assembly protein PilV
MSLVEVLLAAVIMAAALGAIFQALGLGVRGTERIEEELLATNLAQDLLDFLTSIPLRHLPATAPGGPSFTAIPLPRLAEAFSTSADASIARAVRSRVSSLTVPPRFQVLTSIEPVPVRGRTAAEETPGGSDLRIVTVVVRWTAPLAPGRTVSRKVALASLVTDDQDLSL